jgi:acetyltransferase
MLNRQILQPESIVVIGASNDVTKPGGKVLKNLLEGSFSGKLYVSNPKEDEVQGVRSYRNLDDLPSVDLAVIAIAAKYTPDTIEVLARKKNTRAFIILSAGFSEEGPEGKLLEKRVVEIVNSVNGCLIGPNCVGVFTPQYQGAFTEPVPQFDPMGIDFITSSGATACFILEAAVPVGLRFANIFSVGNSAQMGVEDILGYMDVTFDPEKSPRTKMLYIESVSKPEKLLMHASSLVRKGCRIAAIKAGVTEAGSRAASSHTGAMANPDVAVDALLRKAGVVRCYSREELIAICSLFSYPPIEGRNIAIITHAGGPAVMLTDALSAGGFKVPHLDQPFMKDLLAKLYPGSSVANPIDFLATGTAEQLGEIIDFVDEKCDNIDAMVVIFGTPGLTRLFDVYKLLDQKIRSAKKPVLPVLPSTLTAGEEVKMFIDLGHVNFPFEVSLANALIKVRNTEPPADRSFPLPEFDKPAIRAIVDSAPDGYLPPESVAVLLDAVGIDRAGEATVTTPEAAVEAAARLGYPVVMKVVGPVHKSDVGGVVLNVKDAETVVKEFNRMIKIPETTAILLQPMLSGVELFAGAKFEPGFGHLVLCGMGGIFIEVLKDVSSAIAPVGYDEAMKMILRLKSYKIIGGIRGKEGVDELAFANAIVRLSALLGIAPEIAELDLNPLLGTPSRVCAVDARMRIEHGDGSDAK